MEKNGGYFVTNICIGVSMVSAFQIFTYIAQYTVRNFTHLFQINIVHVHPTVYINLIYSQ